MSDRERIAAFFDRRAAAWDGIYSGRRPLVVRLWNRLARRNVQVRAGYALRAVPVWTGLRVLDVGCGSGRACIEVAQRGAGEVVGIDVSAGILALAEALARDAGVEERCRFVEQEVFDVEDETGFDVIVANGFFDYVCEPGPVLVHLRRLGRGPLVASFPARHAWRMPLRLAWLAWLAWHDCPLRLYDGDEIEHLCAAAGWRVEERIESGPIYMVTAR